MDNSDTSFHAGHRARLRQKFLDDKITDYELVELLLSFVIPRRDVRPLARKLLNHFGGIHQLVMAPIDNLMGVPGVGKNTAVFLKAINEILKTDYKIQMRQGKIFHNPKVLYNYCRTLVAGKKTEEQYAFYLDANFHMLGQDLHSTGTVDHTAVYPREILKHAISFGARNVILMHNHPTPNMSFSAQDIKTTTEISALLNLAGIELFDHLVVSGEIVYSARDLQLLRTSKKRKTKK